MKSRRCFPSFLLLVGGGLVAVVVATVAVHNQQQQQQRSRHTGEAGGDVHVDQLGVQRDLGGEVRTVLPKNDDGTTSTNVHHVIYSSAE